MPEFQVFQNGECEAVIVHVHEHRGTVVTLVVEQASARLPSLADVGTVKTD